MLYGVVSIYTQRTSILLPFAGAAGGTGGGAGKVDHRPLYPDHEPCRFDQCERGNTYELAKHFGQQLMQPSRGGRSAAFVRQWYVVNVYVSRDLQS